MAIDPNILRALAAIESPITKIGKSLSPEALRSLSPIQLEAAKKLLPICHIPGISAILSNPVLCKSILPTIYAKAIPQPDLDTIGGAKQKGKRGRPARSGGYLNSDALLLVEMHELCTSNTVNSPTQAAQTVAERARGASLGSKVSRLVKAYHATYSGRTYKRATGLSRGKRR